MWGSKRMKRALKGKEICNGCGACEYVCKQKAITMLANTEGFLYPQVDNEKCTDCGACSKVCSKDITKYNVNIGNAKAFQSKNDRLLFESSSGGLIPSLAIEVINNGGVFYSTEYIPNDKGAFWSRIESTIDIFKTCGSKYFQIPMPTHIIKSILDDLKDREVLFVGTPCQVGALRRVIPATLQDRLVTVDLICGGVQSPSVENKYLYFLSQLKHATVITHKFRAKDYGWKRKYLSVIEYSDGSRELRVGARDLFARMYASGCFLRECCYNCEYVGRSRVGDITAGDCWGMDNSGDSCFKKGKGISLAVANTDKGKVMIESICKNANYMKLNDSILDENKPLNHRTKRPILRNAAYLLLNHLPISLTAMIICYKYTVKRILGKG